MRQEISNIQNLYCNLPGQGVAAIPFVTQQTLSLQLSEFQWSKEHRVIGSRVLKQQQCICIDREANKYQIIVAFITRTSCAEKTMEGPALL